MGKSRNEQLHNIIKKLNKEIPSIFVVLIIIIFCLGIIVSIGDLILVGFIIIGLLFQGNVDTEIFGKTIFSTIVGFIYIIIPLCCIFPLAIYFRQVTHRKKILHLVSKGIENDTLTSIPMKVIGFDYYDYYSYKYPNVCSGMGTHIIVGGKTNKYGTEKFSGKIVGYNVGDLTFLRYLKVDYNPIDIPGMIHELNQIDTFKEIRNRLGEKYNTGGNKIISIILIPFKVLGIIGDIIKYFIKYKSSIFSLKKVNEIKLKFENQLNNGDTEIPYAIINGKHINLGDTMNVYIDPQNSDVFLVDTTPLYD